MYYAEIIIIFDKSRVACAVEAASTAAAEEREKRKTKTMHKQEIFRGTHTACGEVLKQKTKKKIKHKITHLRASEYIITD